jgi:hypothetical protein
VVVGGQYLAIGSHDRKAAGEWMSTVFGSFCTRRLVRVSASLAGSILQVYRGEKRVSWAGLTIGLLQTVYYCRDPRRAIAARLPASCATHRVISKLQARPARNSSPLPSNRASSQKQVLIILKENLTATGKLKAP